MSESGVWGQSPQIKEMAGSTGLEPATSGVTGQRSNQLNYDPVLTTSNFGPAVARSPQHFEQVRR